MLQTREFPGGKPTIEQQMYGIIAAIEIEADKEIIGEARRRQAKEEYERKRLAELAIEKAKPQENEKIALLRSATKTLQQPCTIHSYGKEVQRNAGGQETINEEWREWTKWALQKADWLEPMVDLERKFEDLLRSRLCLFF